MEPPEHLAPKAPAGIAGIRRRVMSEELGDHKLWVFSGCQDDQTSADAYCDGTYQGAFTWALITALRKDVWNQSYLDLLGQIKAALVPVAGESTDSPRTRDATRVPNNPLTLCGGCANRGRSENA